MPKPSEAPRAKSNYGQVRLTVTFEVNGTASYRLMSKRYQDDWKELNVVDQGRVQIGHFPADFSEALAVMVEVLMSSRWAS